MSQPWKRSSQLLNLGGSVTEAAPNTFTEQRVSLPLSSLDREIFVVTDVFIETETPDLNAGTNSNTVVQITKQAAGGIQTINNPNMVGKKEQRFVSLTAEGQLSQDDFPTPLMSTGMGSDYLGVIATPDYFVGVQGLGNTTTKDGFVRITGFRAVASADLYAALVTEELNQ